VLAVLGIRHLAAAGVERAALGNGQTGGRATTRARAVPPANALLSGVRR